MTALPEALGTAGLFKRYANGVQALAGVDLSVRPGETVALVGESGCGKSTLLRMFNRLEQPTAGSVRIDGVDASRLDPIELRRQTGYVPQDGGLLPHWSVARNVELVPRLHGWGEPRRRERCDELLNWVGLDPAEYRRRYPRELSGGQRQRVAIARALAADPQVVLLDEPFGALDALTRAELQREFGDLSRRLARTMLLVTHDLDEAFRLADRVAVMRAGAVLQIDTPEKLRRVPAAPYVERLLASSRGEAP